MEIKLVPVPYTTTPPGAVGGQVIGKWKVLTDAYHFANAYLYMAGGDERWWVTAPRGDFNENRCFVSHASGNRVANVTLPRAVRLCDWVREQLLLARRGATLDTLRK